MFFSTSFSWAKSAFRRLLASARKATYLLKVWSQAEVALPFSGLVEADGKKVPTLEGTFTGLGRLLVAEVIRIIEGKGLTFELHQNVA